MKAARGQLSIGDVWLEKCTHVDLAPLYADGQGLVAQQCSSCLQVFPWRPCAMCGRQTAMKAHSRDAWFCSHGCKRQSAYIKAKGGA